MLNGEQYSSVRPSIGSVDDAYDNALCEAFFATVECELIDRRRFRAQAEACTAIFTFIEGWYNPRPRLLLPVEYERDTQPSA